MNSKPILAALDDDTEILTVVSAMAEKAGFSVVANTQPNALLDLLDETPPLVIVLDLQMPQMDGIQVLRELANRQVQAGIILLTGMDERTIAAAEVMPLRGA